MIFLIIGLLAVGVGYLLWRLRQLEAAAHSPVIYPTQTERIILRRQRLRIEEDALYIWYLKYRGHTHSRQHLVRTGVMSYYRWNRASHLISHLDLRPEEISYNEGKERIQREIEERLRLTEQRNYVMPYEW